MIISFAGSINQSTSSIRPGPLAPGSLAPGSLAPGSLAPGSLAPGSLAPGSLAPIKSNEKMTESSFIEFNSNPGIFPLFRISSL